MTLIGRRDVAVTAWCETCGARSTHATPEVAARQAHTTPRAVYRCLEAGALHFTEEEAGGAPPLVCLRSLGELFSDPPRAATADAEDTRTKLNRREEEEEDAGRERSTTAGDTAESSAALLPQHRSAKE